jgi:carboxyl-terminal processing protease
MSLFRPLLLGAVLFLFAGLPVKGEPARIQLPAAAEEAWRIVGRAFYDESRIEQIWGDARLKHAPALQAAGSETELSAAINKMLAELKASHTAHYTPLQPAYYELIDIFSRGGEFRRRIERLFPRGEVAYVGIGANTKETDGRTFVTGVYERGPAHKAGLLAGDEILTADGEPFHAVRSFRERQDQPVALRIRRHAATEPIQLAVTPERLRPGDGFLAALEGSARVIESAGVKIGYVHIWSYASDRYHQALAEILARGVLKDADALVLDLRDGWGGAQPDYAELFVGGGPDMLRIDRDGREHLSYFRWKRPVVALVNEGTRSGKEIIAHTLQKRGIPLVGTRTAGFVLAGTVQLLSDDSLLLFAVQDVRVDGERLEGVGVKPDVEVAFDLRYAAGRDPQLDRAVDMAAAKAAAPRL